ncbi:MAG: TlpA family protein disulfide reductase [Rhodoferax sp.]
MSIPPHAVPEGAPAVTAASRRQALYVGAAALAALGGACLAWWKFQPRALTPADTVLWDMTFEMPSGGKLVMQSLRGKPLLVNFWATWCPPCIAEMPLLDGFFQKNMVKNWQVVGLAIDRPDPVTRFLRTTPVSYPIGMAGFEGMTLVRTLGDGVGGLPFSVVFNGAGMLVHRKIGKLAPEDLHDWAMRS